MYVHEMSVTNQRLFNDNILTPARAVEGTPSLQFVPQCLCPLVSTQQENSVIKNGMNISTA
jgi:hypothetical protein